MEITDHIDAREANFWRSAEQFRVTRVAENMGRLILMGGNAFGAITGDFPVFGLVDNPGVRGFSVIAVGIQGFMWGMRHTHLQAEKNE